jgi:hypothetical protein
MGPGHQPHPAQLTLAILTVPTALDAAVVLDLSDVGSSMDSGRQRLLLASAGQVVASGAGPGRLSLAAAERVLLEVRRRTFGDILQGHLRCPSCEMTLSVQIDATRLADDNPPGPSGPVIVEVDGLRIEARLPTLDDLAVAAGRGPWGSVRLHLVDACVVSARDPQGEVPASDLTDEVIAKIGDALVAADPFAELCVAPTCDACGATWSAVVDMGRWLWDEVDASAERLLDQVHLLASAYGWSEDAVVSLSPRRRRAYADRVVND